MPWISRPYGFGKTLPRRGPCRQEGARAALLALTAINLLNFADRYVASSVKELIKADLGLTDTETALPASGMVLVYMVSAVCFGLLNDREAFDRRALLAGGVAFWSLATAAAALAQDLGTLVALRSLVGVGEAAYGTIAPAYLADFYPPRERNVVFGVFYLAIPVGGALGFGVGAVVGEALGWRTAFMVGGEMHESSTSSLLLAPDRSVLIVAWGGHDATSFHHAWFQVCGLPGLLAAGAVLRLNDPPRGENDPTPADHHTGIELQTPGGQQGEEETAFKAVTFAAAAEATAGGEGAGDVTEPASSSAADPDLVSSPLSAPSVSASVASLPAPPPPTRMGDVRLILANRYFCASVAGLTLNSFALGGLVDWYRASRRHFDTPTLFCASPSAADCSL